MGCKSHAVGVPRNVCSARFRAWQRGTQPEWPFHTTVNTTVNRRTNTPGASHPTSRRMACSSVLGVHVSGMLIGACYPTMSSFHLFRPTMLFEQRSCFQRTQWPLKIILGYYPISRHLSNEAIFRGDECCCGLVRPNQPRLALPALIGPDEMRCHVTICEKFGCHERSSCE